MTKPLRPDGTYYTARSPRERLRFGLGTDGRSYARGITAAEDDYLERAFEALDYPSLTAGLDVAAKVGLPDLDVTYSPRTGRLLFNWGPPPEEPEPPAGSPAEPAGSPAAEPAARSHSWHGVRGALELVPDGTTLAECLGLEPDRTVHYFMLPMRRRTVRAGRGRRQDFTLYVVDYDRGENN
jgi:hypothetical protein